jgi:thymidine kinase
MLNMRLHTHTYQVLSVTELMDKDGLDINHLVRVGDELCEIDGICPTCSRFSTAFTCMHVRLQRGSAAQHTDVA